MENNELSLEELERRYPPCIVEWEMKHGIMRYEKNGVTYVCCARPFADVCESLDKENESIKARFRLKELGLLK